MSVFTKKEQDLWDDICDICNCTQPKDSIYFLQQHDNKLITEFLDDLKNNLYIYYLIEKWEKRFED